MIFLILLFHFKSIPVPAGDGIYHPEYPGSLCRDLDHGSPVSLTTFLGLVTLIGLVVRNGIIMFDYAEMLRQEGSSVKEAAFRPAAGVSDPYSRLLPQPLLL